MEALWLILAVVVGAGIGWFGAWKYAQLKFNQPVNERSEDDLNEIIALKEEVARKEQEIEGLFKEMGRLKTEQEEQNKTLLLQFEDLANKVLESKSKKFTEQNKENLDGLLGPLKEKMEKFEKAVQETNKEQHGRHEALKEQLGQLSELNKQMSTDAQSLTMALKGDSKKQGDWGELVLERTLELSGLRKGKEYDMQQSSMSEDGRRLQPDVIVNLPDGKKLVIDSKVTLVSADRLVAAESEEEREKLIKEFLTSVKKHVNDLHDKHYHEIYKERTLDFVIMFMPKESTFSLALQHDDTLYDYAFDKNIVMVSPTTLLATLRTIANIWKHEYQNRHVLEIAEQAGRLYDKFVGFTNDLVKVGTQMERTQDTYKDAMNKLSKGTGNLVKRAEDIKKLGAKASKSIDDRLLRRAEEDQNLLPEANIDEPVGEEHTIEEQNDSHDEEF